MLFIIIRLLFSQRNKGQGGLNVFDIGKSKAKLFKPEHVTISFKEVAGLDEAKFEVKEFVDFLQKPGKYE